ncbi:MAG: ROK family protein [Spirochaetales bacterium]
MKREWYQPTGHWDRYILAGDVGGTNTNLGLVGARGDRLELLFELETPSKNVTDFPSLVKQTLAELGAERPDAKIDLVSIGANGPVKDNHCHIHNLNWQISGAEVKAATGLPTAIVNDFTSVSYALPFVAVNDAEQAAVLHAVALPGRSDQAASVRAVIGAGTGMGVGILTQQGSHYTALPSEGGHIDFAPFDDDSLAFHGWLMREFGTVPSVELACSGIGLRNLYRFALASGWITAASPLKAAVEKAGLEDAPRQIAQLATSDASAKRLMQNFIRLYARFAANIAMTTLPHAGLYLAGGIGSKNLAWFRDGNLFEQTYLTHNNRVVREFLEGIPVYMILNYNTALVGAANAGINLL